MTHSWPIRARDLLGKVVRVGAVDVGSISGVLGNRTLAYVFGLEVRGRDGHRHFVPWVAAELQAEGVYLTSVFSLLSTSELALYVDNGVRVTDRAPEARVARDGQISQPATSDDSTDAEISSVQLAANRSMP